MSISVIVATYGSDEWSTLAQERAIPSTEGHGWGYHDRFGTIASCRNEAAEQCTSDFYCFLDADDSLAPGYIRAMEAAVEQQPNATRLLFTPAVQIVRGRNRQSAPTFFKEVPLRDANWLVIGTLVHRDLFWEVGGFDNHPHGFEDFSLWSKCVRAGATVVKVPDAVYRYWANPNSAHRQGWRDKKWQRETHHKVIADLDAWEAARA